MTNQLWYPSIYVYYEQNNDAIIELLPHVLTEQGSVAAKSAPSAYACNRFCKWPLFTACSTSDNRSTASLQVCAAHALYTYFSRINLSRSSLENVW